jgi:hypothetical protein
MDDGEFLSLFDALRCELAVEIVTQLELLLIKWKAVFSLHEPDLGRTDLVTCIINMVKQRHRHIPPTMFQEVKQHLSNMLKSGVIRESSSPWSSPLVIARKHDSSLKLCIDLREINSCTLKDAYYLPRITETLDSLSGSQFFTCLDLKMAD